MDIHHTGFSLTNNFNRWVIKFNISHEPDVIEWLYILPIERKSWFDGHSTSSAFYAEIAKRLAGHV